jgi:DNA-directed RNA polymerase II subunit RPB2
MDKSDPIDMDNATIWKILETYFTDNPQALVRHHIDSYNDFYKTGIYQIFKEKNPIRLYSRPDPNHPGEYLSQCNLYMGGRNGDKLYFGKPVISDDNGGSNSSESVGTHYMYPNEARLRNMTYGMTIHYDVEVEYIDTLAPGEMPKAMGTEGVEWTEEKGPIQNVKKTGLQEGGVEGVEGTESDKKTQIPLMTPSAATKIREATEKSVDSSSESGGLRQIHRETLSKIYLGKFPIMVQSDFCILSGLPREVRHTMGECRNDLGGYFIIDGKEKTVVAQEKFADNMLYVHKVTNDDYTYMAEIVSVSEDVSKPVRRLSVGIAAPSSKYTNGNIVVNIPNVRKPVPLFIVFRALGIISDKDIISHCLLDLDKNDHLVDLFIPSVHDATTVLTQKAALQYLMLLIKKGSSTAQVLHILADYFLPHVGETNYISKAYYLGWMVHRLLAVSQGLEPETDRDNFKFKRIELVGELLSGLFREYWTLQMRRVHVDFESRLYFSEGIYENNLPGLIQQGYRDVFRERTLETGFKKAFKGNWGAQTHTKRIGVIQDLNRLSFNSALNHLRKTNLPLPAGVKLVGPRVLHNSQWGFLDPIDTPDGGSIGLHKHLSISTYITRGASREPMIEWLREKWGMKFVEEMGPRLLAQATKVIINGYWAGAVEKPVECLERFRLYRRNALLPIYASCTFDIETNTIYIYTDSGRVCRPVFYCDEMTGQPSYKHKEVSKILKEGGFRWEDLVSGFNKKRENPAVPFDLTNMHIYQLGELYEGVPEGTAITQIDRFLTNKSILDYIDASESENALIALNVDEFETALRARNKNKNKNNDNSVNAKAYTHSEIHNSLIFGMMANMIIYPENNPAVRNAFSCGQSKQAVSVYHTNYQSRMDKASVVLSYGQTPLVKSRFLEFITGEENSYGENAIVAIACYTGYNVEDAILVNEASLKRGMFRTSYFSTYEAHEESTKNADTVVDKRFMNIESEEAVVGVKPGYDYSKLDEYGLIKEGTPVDDKTVLIGLATVSAPSAGSAIASRASYIDGSKTPKKGQLGVVERAFITDGEEGQRIAKVRVLETRIPAMGDKMASRAGQKGTIGMVIREQDMPFTADGIRPDMIINPHALPTRMTIGQLVECITGKACAFYGGFGDCTAFNNEGSKIGVFGELLPKCGFHSSGNEILYNGMTGEQIESTIFMGPTYYMRLKQLVKDKINYRARGPNTALTKQPVGGRANDGGLRIGEMERDTVISHGMTDFLRESMMERADKYYMAVCNKTGMISVYNPSRGLFMSPMADGPLKFAGSLESDDLRVEQVTKFGRDFSVVCVPYSLKLLIQELEAMNVSLRIITEDNIDQMENMAYSKNMDLLVQETNVDPRSLFSSIRFAIQYRMDDQRKNASKKKERDQDSSSVPRHERFTEFYGDLRNVSKGETVEPGETGERGEKEEKESPDYPDVSPAYVPDMDEVKDYSPYTDSFNPYSPPQENGENRRVYSPHSPEEPPPPDSIEEDSPLEEGEEPELQVGGKYFLKGGGKRQCEVTHIGDRYASVKTDEMDGNNVLVVLKSDLMSPDAIPQVDNYPYTEYNANQGQEVGIAPTHLQGQAPTPPVVIHFAPKLFNHGNDHSVTTEPQPSTTSTSTMMDMNDVTPVEIVKPSPDLTRNSVSNDNNHSEEIDFSRPIIVKKDNT